jgi:hypothetical protein
MLLESWEALDASASPHPPGPSENSNSSIIKPGSTVICLSEKEGDDAAGDLWQNSPARLRALQSIFHSAAHVFWVTRGCQADDPRANAMVGIARTVVCESPHLRCLFIDVENHVPSSPPASRTVPLTLTEMLLRMVWLDRFEHSDVL